IDPKDESRTFITYYFYGAAIALAMDLSIREVTANAASLDDYMQWLWRRFGKSADARPGYVARPYTLKDLRDGLADVTKNKAFADEFFDRYVEGREVADYAALLARAGYALHPRSPEAGWAGNVQVRQVSGGLEVMGVVPFDT